MNKLSHGCTLDCFDCCKFNVYVEEGKIIKIEGDKEHPYTKGFICKKGLAHLNRLNHHKRIYKPLLKVKGKWKEITFDEAIEIMVHKLKGYKDKYSPKSVLYYEQYGNGSLLKSIGDIFFNFYGGASKKKERFRKIRLVAQNEVFVKMKEIRRKEGHYYKDGKFVCYRDMSAPAYRSEDDLETACRKIREKLTAGIEKRLDADAPVGFLLSGGLDSSLVCAVAARCSKKPIRTFSIGMDIDAIDLKYAREVADYLGADHTEVIITKADVLEALPKVVALLGTYDITTIRASIGMYLVCKYIHEHTDLRVLLTGEISDELFGYKYTDFAPSAEAFQKEAEKRMLLRRCICSKV